MKRIFILLICLPITSLILSLILCSLGMRGWNPFDINIAFFLMGVFRPDVIIDGEIAYDVNMVNDFYL